MIAIRWTYTEGFFGTKMEQKYDTVMVETQDDLEGVLQVINDDYNRIISEEDYEVKLDSIEYFQCTAVDNPKEFLK